MEMDKLKPKQSAFITRVGGDGALRHHLLDMGLTPGTEITLQKIAPMGDPIQIEVRGYELTLRLDEAKKIEIENIHERKVVADSKPQRHKSIPHPRVGELGEANDYHIHDESKALPKDSKLHLRLQETKTAAKPLCLISLRALISMWAIFRVLP